MQKRQVLFSVIILATVSTLAISLSLSRPAPVTNLGATIRRLSFGSSGIGTVGWLVPAGTLISTSYSANQSISRFLVGILNVFLYRIQPNTSLYLSLYLNGQYITTQNYTLNNFSNSKIPATITANLGSQLAQFTDSKMGPSVSDFPLKASLPVGTVMTVTAWANNPIWVQVDTTAITHSYESLVSSNYVAPPTIIPESGDIAPYTLSVELESNA